MPLTNPYQIQETDKDLLTLATRLGMDYKAVQAANPSITSISKGQFINIPKTTTPTNVASSLDSAQSFAGVGTGSFLAAGGTVANTNMQTPSPTSPAASPNMNLINQGVPPSVAALYGQPSPSQAQNPQSSGSFLSGAGTVNQGRVERVFFLKQTFENAMDPSQLPNMVTASDINAAGYTSADMIVAGYTLSNGSWVKKNQTGGAGPTNTDYQKTAAAQYYASHNTPFLSQQRWDPEKRKYITVGQWLSQQGRKPEKRTRPGNRLRPDTPSTTLDVVLGS